eukprot:15076-Heterococcus_DN1.PRE.3
MHSVYSVYSVVVQIVDEYTMCFISMVHQSATTNKEKALHGSALVHHPSSAERISVKASSDCSAAVQHEDIACSTAAALSS